MVCKFEVKLLLFKKKYLLTKCTELYITLRKKLSQKLSRFRQNRGLIPRKMPEEVMKFIPSKKTLNLFPFTFF